MTRVPYLDVPGTAAWVSRRGPEGRIADLTEAMGREFARWPELETRPRLASHSRDGVIELMPAADAETFGFKLVNGHPANPARGFQTVTAVGMLASVHNGYPTFLAEMTILTALRTAATSALAARYLAPRGGTVHALIGCGAQAEFQALGLRTELGLNELRVFDVDPRAVDKLVHNAKELGFEVTVCDGPGEAARGAAVVTTCTADKRNAVVLRDDDVAVGVDGQHVNALGGDCPGKTELEPATLLRADAVVVEQEEQTRVEGELQNLPPDFSVTELWQVVTGARPGRRGDGELTVFDSVGFGVEDFATLRFVAEDLRAHGPAPDPLLGWLDLIAEPSDPKDLFSLVKDVQTLPLDPAR